MWVRHNLTLRMFFLFSFLLLLLYIMFVVFRGDERTSKCLIQTLYFYIMKVQTPTSLSLVFSILCFFYNDLYFMPFLLTVEKGNMTLLIAWLLFWTIHCPDKYHFAHLIHIRFTMVDMTMAGFHSRTPRFFSSMSDPTSHQCHQIKKIKYQWTGVQIGIR